MKTLKQRKVSFRLLAWLLILSQALSSAAFADINVFSKDTLAPQVLSQTNPPDETAAQKEILLIEISSVFNSIGRSHFVKRRPVGAIPKDIRDQYRNTPALFNAIEFESLRLDGNAITIWYNDPEDGMRHQARIFPKDHGSSEAFGIRFKAEPVVESEPLIGHEFTDKELVEVAITPWSESETFAEALLKLKDVISTGAPNEMKTRLLNTLDAFEFGKDGRQLGMVQSRYDSSEKYYLGFGIAGSIALSSDFFDPISPLYKYRLEALFHELFHAAFGRGGEYAAKHDTSVHFQAMRIAAMLFWGMSKEDTEWLVLEELEKHPKNEFGSIIREWKTVQRFKSEQVDIPKATAKDDWKYLLAKLRSALKISWQGEDGIAEFLSACNNAAVSMRRHPVEARYPLLKAVALLSKEEKERLVTVLTDSKHAATRELPIVDSILLMLRKEIPKDWISRQASLLKGRSVWIVASEIWNPGGGLGRVEQSHSIGFQKLMQYEGTPLKTIEPYYVHTKGKKSGIVEPSDYAGLLGVNPEDIKEIEGIGRFKVPVGAFTAVAVCYRVINRFGIESYLIKGYREGQNEAEAPYYTEMLYHYSGDEERNIVSLEEFSVFFSKASLELTRRVEEESRALKGAAYNPPVIHFNDGQLGYAPLFRRLYYSNDPVLGNNRAMVGFTTHTYPNRCVRDKVSGERTLEWMNIPREAWKYFHHREKGLGTDKWNTELVDQTSAGIRTADWSAGVSLKHVEDILSYLHDNWGEWIHLNDTMVSVTNGDVRELTAHKFREIMIGLFPDADLDDPKPEQILETKRAAKRSLGLRDDQPVVSYSGRVVWEKASSERALSMGNIEKMVSLGIQVVIGANIAGRADLIDEFAIRADTIKRKKQAEPDKYPGSFTLLCNIDREDQYALLAATDIQIQDSDPQTEAAGYWEANISGCFGLELAPPWKEGVLQSQGILINPDVLGEGNTIVPKDGNPQSYIDALKLVLFDKPKELNMEPAVYLSHYQATSGQLSRIGEAPNTSAEYLRQWSSVIAKRDAAPDQGEVSRVSKGTIRDCLDTIFNSDLRLKSDISTEHDLRQKRLKTPYTVYSLGVVRKEVEMLRALGILIDGTSPHTSRLRSQIRNLSPPEFDELLLIPELDHPTIPEDKIPALRERINKLVSDIYNRRPKDITITSASDFAGTAALKVADEIRRLQRERPGKDVTMVFATGNTMEVFLDELSRSPGIDWGRIQAYHLDGYKKLDITHKPSFAYYLDKNIFSKVPIPPANIHYICDYVRQHGKEEGFRRYLADMGTQDITIVGIGPDGHLAFNEPPKYSSFDSTMQEVPLDKSTRDVNKENHPALADVEDGGDPSAWFAYTMGMADIFKSGKIFQFVNRPGRAAILARAMYGDVTEAVPSSMLQMHPNVSWVIDEAAIVGAKTDISLIETERRMSTIHDMNMDLLPRIENEKILYHVIAEELIPVTMRAHMEKLARYTENQKLRERIRIATRKDIKDTVDELSGKPQNIVLAAIQHKEDLVFLPKGVKALVFTGNDGGAYGFRQIEGIMAALRALERSDAPALARLYGILTGKPFAGKESDILKYIQDPQALAEFIIFNLEPSTAKDGAELKRLNNRLLEFLYKA